MLVRSFLKSYTLGFSIMWTKNFQMSKLDLVKVQIANIHCIIEKAVAAKSLQSCPTLWDPIDGNPTGSPVPGILQARILEWVAISFSNAWKWKVNVKSLSPVRLSATPWTAAYEAPPPMGFSRQEYWSGVPSPSPISSWGNTLKRRYFPGTWGKTNNYKAEPGFTHVNLTPKPMFCARVLSGLAFY